MLQSLKEITYREKYYKSYKPLNKKIRYNLILRKCGYISNRKENSEAKFWNIKYRKPPKKENFIVDERS